MDYKKERYARHLLVDGFTEQHQMALSRASVFVAGSGGLGSAILTYLAAAGIGTLGIVDFDVVSESNLNRQVLYHPGLVGKSKAYEAVGRISQINPDCRLVVFEQKMEAGNIASMIADFDLVADATDNFATRYILDDACAKANKPFVYATAEQWGGQVSVFHYRGAKGYRQLYPEEPPVSLSPPGIIGPVAGLVGLYSAIETIKIITGLGDVLSGKLLCLDALTHKSSVYVLGKA